MEETKLTLFYFKDTGDIKAYCTGVQNMHYFGSNNTPDSIDYVIVKYDIEIIRNKDNYCIDLATKAVKKL